MRDLKSTESQSFAGASEAASKLGYAIHVGVDLGGIPWVADDCKILAADAEGLVAAVEWLTGRRPSHVG